MRRNEGEDAEDGAEEVGHRVVERLGQRASDRRPGELTERPGAVHDPERQSLRDADGVGAMRRQGDPGRVEAADIAFVCADLLEYEPERGAYELVLVLYLQLPAAERRLVLSRAAGALAPGGTFFLVGHDLTNLRDGVGGPSDPEVLYTPDDIVAEVPGLVVVKAERVLRDVADADRPAIDALVRARRPER